MEDIERIDTQDDLVALANRLGVRPNWHEPDEREVTAKVFGNSFDNAGFWGDSELVRAVDLGLSPSSVEIWVTIYQAGEPVAEVNLAMLFAWACGYRG